MDKNYDERHGGPYDRGATDAWFSRPYVPHYYKGDVNLSELVKQDNMTTEELEAYKAGWTVGIEWNRRKEYY